MRSEDLPRDLPSNRRGFSDRSGYIPPHPARSTFATMCDHHAFKPSARGNMNLPFFQNNLHCGHLHCGNSHDDRSPSLLSWASPEDWVQSTQLHEIPVCSPSSSNCIQHPYILTDADQHDLALALCVDECGECDDPTCSEPDCEADLIECTEASCSQPPVPGACHGNNTLCAGNLPPDVLDGAVSLAALRPPSTSYGNMYPPQPTDQYLPLCVAIAAGYYNPGHIHSHIPNCGPHTYINEYHDSSLFNSGHSIITQSFGPADGYAFGHSNQMCQYSGMYYDMNAQTVSQLEFQPQLQGKEDSSSSTLSPGPHQSFSFTHNSTSSISAFPSPIHRNSISTSEQAQVRSLSPGETFPPLPTCRWELGHDVVCDQTFETTAQLQNHIQQMHTAPLRKANGFTCQWKGCPRREKGGESFAQRSKLDRHVQSHTGYKASICSICGQQFSTTQSLVLHQRTHSGEKPHKCPFPGCGYAAAQASQLTMHNRTKHTKEKPLRCDFPGCNARFAESSNLSKHKKIHLPEAQCACHLCFKSFSREDQLKRHLKTHAKKAFDVAGRNLGLGAGLGPEAGSFGFAEMKTESESR